MTIADLARQECMALTGDHMLRGRSLLELLTIAFLRGSVLAHADNKQLPAMPAEAPGGLK